MKDHIEKLKKIVFSLESGLEVSKNTEVNINRKLTENASSLKEKAGKLEAELEDITQELYAERLEKAQAIEELEETKNSLKKEYELSLENMQR